MKVSLAPAQRNRHEGVAYLLGRTDGLVTLAVTVFQPEATTTRGSFHVESRAMAPCVRAAVNLELQVVAQVHTHPGRAYHSDGDVEGARIRYAGYVSIVLPDYGRRLPSLNEAAIYMSTQTNQWTELTAEEVKIVAERTQ
jgi:proteasome lid subunit RPN8/RPN11